MYQIKLKSEYEDLDKFKNNNGEIFYYKKDTGIWHNPYGPAIICKNGVEEYWVNGESLNKEEFEIHPERLKFLGKEHLICLK